MFAHKIFLRVHVTLATLYRTLCILMPLCGHTMHVPHTWQHFWTMWCQFFFCLVCGPLEKKDKRQNYSSVTEHAMDKIPQQADTVA